MKKIKTVEIVLSKDEINSILIEYLSKTNKIPSKTNTIFNVKNFPIDYGMYDRADNFQFDTWKLSYEEIEN